MYDVSYELLGPLRVLRHGEEVDLGGRKQRTVLAALLLTPGRVVSVDRLIDMVWGEEPPPSAMSSLQAYISHLRRVLRDSVDATSPIVRRAPGYLLDVDPAELDVTAFLAHAEAAREHVRVGDWDAAVVEAGAALALGHGAVLEDLADEEWARVAAAPLEERRAGCERDQVTALLGAGRPAEALAAAGRLAAAQPLDEQACWLHAVALHQVGRTADALAVLRAFHDLLGEELGLDPGPALRELQERLLRQDPGLEHWPAASRSVGPLQASEPLRGSEPVVALTAGRPDPATAIIGRADDLATVAAAWAGAADGGAPWLVLTGPPGIGKSRLASEAVALWPGTSVSTVCPEDAGLPTWWPLRQLVRELGGRPEVVLQNPGGTRRRRHPLRGLRAGHGAAPDPRRRRSAARPPRGRPVGRRLDARPADAPRHGRHDPRAGRPADLAQRLRGRGRRPADDRARPPVGRSAGRRTSPVRG